MKQEYEAIRNDISIARIVTGMVLGALFAATVMLGSAIAAKPAAADEALNLWIDRAVVVDRLGKIYEEAPRELGITSEGAVVELFIAEDGRTWTIVVTLPNGMSSIIASGENWMQHPLAVKGRMS